MPDTLAFVARGYVFKSLGYDAASRVLFECFVADSRNVAPRGTQEPGNQLANLGERRTSPRWSNYHGASQVRHEVS
jgi:hypothetical protein